MNELEKRREGPWPDIPLPLSASLAIAIAMAMPASLANFEHRGLQTRIHPSISSQHGMTFIGSVGSLFCSSSRGHPVTTFFSQTHRILFILRGERVHGEHCYCTRSSGPAHTSLGGGGLASSPLVATHGEMPGIIVPLIHPISNVKGLEREMTLA
jgi:hypothetical protein